MIRILMAAATASALICNNASAYDFSNDAADSEATMIRDIQNHRLDVSKFSGLALDYLYRTLRTRIVTDVLFSPLERVCSNVAVLNDQGFHYQFRAIYSKGVIDWIVRPSQEDANFVEYIALIVLPQGDNGPPGILPALREGNNPAANRSAPVLEGMVPATQIGCLTDEERLKAREATKAACKQFPQFCPVSQ